MRVHIRNQKKQKYGTNLNSRGKSTVECLFTFKTEKKHRNLEQIKIAGGKARWNACSHSKPKRTEIWNKLKQQGKKHGWSACPHSKPKKLKNGTNLNSREKKHGTLPSLSVSTSLYISWNSCSVNRSPTLWADDGRPGWWPESVETVWSNSTKNRSNVAEKTRWCMRWKGV